MRRRDGMRMVWIGAMVGVTAVIGGGSSAWGQGPSLEGNNLEAPAIAPDTVNGLLRRAHAQLAVQRFEEAARLFSDYLKRYPKAAQVRDALYFQGYALFQLGPKNYRQ